MPSLTTDDAEINLAPNTKTHDITRLTIHKINCNNTETTMKIEPDDVVDMSNTKASIQRKDTDGEIQSQYTAAATVAKNNERVIT